jgi:tRNA-uridine 2-sulfurtransferase
LGYYTLGQRQGLGVGGTREGTAAPWFVARKDMATNALVVVQGHDHPALFRREIAVAAMHWIAGHAPVSRARVGLSAKTRYRMADAPCALTLQDGGRARVTFDTAQWAPTPGQYLVLYDGDVCLGGGVIVERHDVAEGAMPTAAPELAADLRHAS